MFLRGEGLPKHHAVLRFFFVTPSFNEEPRKSNEELNEREKINKDRSIAGVRRAGQKGVRL